MTTSIHMSRPIIHPACPGCYNAPSDPANPHGWCDDCNLIASVDRPNDEGVAR